MTLKPNLDQLKVDLQKALEIEFFTIPLYLTALYSIDENKNLESRDILQSVVMEEMLHMALIANIINAVGGKPKLINQVTRKFYPAKIPHIESTKKFDLLSFSKISVKQFILIEQPDFDVNGSHGKLDTIGEFYDRLSHNLIYLCHSVSAEKELFSGDPKLQIDERQFYYGAGGKIIPVNNLASALEAINQIADQGEGRKKIDNLSGNHARFGQPKEPAHYYRFIQLLHERKYKSSDNISSSPTGSKLYIDWESVSPIQKNPKKSNVPSHIRSKFDNCYELLLANLEKGFNGSHHFLEKAILDMHELRNQINGLMNIPSNANSLKSFGPPFWYILSPEVTKS